MKFLLTVFVFMVLKMYELLYFILMKAIPFMGIFLLVMGVVVSAIISVVGLVGCMIYLFIYLVIFPIDFTLDFVVCTGTVGCAALLFGAIIISTIIEYLTYNSRNKIKQFFKDNWVKANKIVTGIRKNNYDVL